MDSVNILHDGCSGEDRGKKYSKLATTEQFYGAGTSKKVVPLRWCKATTAHAFTIGSPTVISIHEKTWIFHGFSREYRRMHHWGHFQWPGTVVWGISNEKYFHQISNSYFQSCFLLKYVEIFMLFRTKLDAYARIQDSSADKPYEKHCIFWWKLAKI